MLALMVQDEAQLLAPSNFDSSSSSTWSLLFCFMLSVTIYKKVIKCTMGTQIYMWRGASRMMKLKTKQVMQHICPHRRARWYKCYKKRQAALIKKQEQQGQSQEGFCHPQGCHAATPEECCLMACAKSLMLPPPLPWRKKTAASKKKSKASCCTTNNGNQTSMSKEEAYQALPEAEHCLDETETSSLSSSDFQLQESTSSSIPIPEETTEPSKIPPQLQLQQQQQELPQQLQQQQQHPVAPAIPQTPLIDLARMQNWNLLKTQATRRAAKKRDADGLLPLHWAVAGGPPVDVVETLLQVYPSAAKKLDKEQSSALHFCTHYAASFGVIHAVYQANPRAVSQLDRYGRSPLYHAVDKCVGLEALQLLVRADPRMVTVPCVQAEYRELPLTRVSATLTPLYMAWAHVVRGGQKLKKTCKRYEKALLLLEAAFWHAQNVQPSIPKDYYFLSGAIAMDYYLPEQVVALAIDEQPQQVSRRNSRGRDALAQAAATLQHSAQRADTLVQWLLNAHAASVFRRDRDNHSPLQLALQAGKTWDAGVARLFVAHPAAIGGQAGTLPPFALAATREAQEQAARIPHEEEDAEHHDTWLIRRADPYNMLSSKQRDLLKKARQRLEEANHAMSEEKDHGRNNPETERLSTIFTVLAADPSSLSAAVAATAR